MTEGGDAKAVPRSAYVGPRWRLVTVGYQDDVYAVPASLDAWIRFRPDGRLQMNDSVNASGGEFTSTPEGFRRTHMASTLVGYFGTDPVRLAVVQGMSAVLGLGLEARLDTDVSVGMSSARLVLGVDGYELSFERPTEGSD